MNSGIKGAVFFDYDGTLTDEIARIPVPTKGTLEAIALLRKNGYLAILATGRAECYASGTGIVFDGMVTSNGTHAAVNGEVILDRPIPPEILDPYVEYMDAHNIVYGIDHPVSCYARDKSDPFYLDWAEYFSLPLEVYHETAPGEKIRGYKVSALYRDAAELEGMRANFGNVLEFTSVSGYNCLDVGEKGSNKSDGVRAVISHFGIARENTYAFGDGLNDAEMFRAVGHPVAMGRHAPALDAIAEYVTGTVAEDGIANALRHYGLIGKE